MMAAGVAAGGVAPLACASGETFGGRIRHLAMGPGRIRRVPAARNLRGPGCRAAGSVDRVARPRTGCVGRLGVRRDFHRRGVGTDAARAGGRAAPGLSSATGPFRQGPHRCGAAAAGAGLAQAGRAVRSGFSLERAAGLRRLCAMRALRGCLSRFRGRTAVEPEGADSDLASAATHGTLIGSGAIVEADTLWACTTCRACVSECPMMIEHVDAVVDLRRFQTLELGATPGKAVQALQELRATDTVCGRSTAKPARLGGRPEAAASGARRIVRRAAVAGRGGFRSARPAHAACSGSSAAAGRGRLRGCWAPTSSTAATSRAGSVTRRPLRSSRAAMSRRWQSDALLVS